MPPDRAQGIFETMLVRARRVQAMSRHLDRLAHSAGALYDTSLPRDLPARVIATAAGLTGEHRLRVDVIPGEDIHISAAPVAPGYRGPVTAEPLVIPGGLGPHKWRDRGALNRGGATPLLVDQDGTVLEAAWGNVWLLEDDVLITPPADGRILPGVTRALLLELAASLGLRAQEQPISVPRLRAAPVTFATSAIRLAVPITITGSTTSPAPVVQRIQSALAVHD